MPLPLLQKWGWLLFLFSLGLITIGLLPYRKLTRLQSKPNELRIVEQGYLEFWARGQCQLLFPLKDIERLQYCEKKDPCHPENTPIPEPANIKRQAHPIFIHEKGNPAGSA